MGTVCFAPYGNNEPIKPKGFAATQTFFGGSDQDIGPAINGDYTIPFRINCAADAPLVVSFTADRTGWIATSEISFQVVGADGNVRIWGVQGVDDAGLTDKGTSLAGLHQLLVKGTALPTTGSSFAMKVTYTAPQNLSANQPF
jgi:hypothetical protein